MSSPVESAASWLSKQGYPLEYEVARTMRQAGFRAWQGLYFRDTEGDQRTREIDVVAADWPENETRRTAVEFAIEVKYSHEPWLVLTTEMSIEPANTIGYRLASPPAIDVLQGLARTPPVPSLLTVAPRHGFNVVQMVESDKGKANPAYVALASVVKAAAFRVSQWKDPAIVMPAVVVGGSLVQLGYDAQGGQILEEVQWQRVIWHGSSVVDHPVIVDVIRDEQVASWARYVRAASQTISETFEAWVRKPG